MDLATLDISPDEAADRLAAYRALDPDQRTPTDEGVLAGYRAAARGLPLIQLRDAIGMGGYFDNGLPRLAVVRADARYCWCTVNRWWGPRNRNDIVYCATDDDRGRAAVGRYRVALTLPRPTGYGDVRRSGRTLVPTVPPEHRPKRHLLGRFHILWEVEAWEDVAPRDPALLRHVRGDLWAVLATWDLTELERAVLSAGMRDG